MGRTDQRADDASHSPDNSWCRANASCRKCRVIHEILVRRLVIDLCLRAASCC
ncbi:hypothetical protein SFR_0539 [Streptomyces sp. FR-008]|nr:hypothetical protein SFR_0539 [Streptomyces sp. FR-008]